jgi:vacuolar-type H+-ATPase subunit I/STV1
MTFGAVRAVNQPTEFTVSSAATNPQIKLLSMSFLIGVVLLFVSFGVSGWTRSRAVGIATTILSLIGALVAFVALAPFLHVQ